MDSLTRTGSRSTFAQHLSTRRMGLSRHGARTCMSRPRDESISPEFEPQPGLQSFMGFTGPGSHDSIALSNGRPAAAQKVLSLCPDMHALSFLDERGSAVRGLSS